MIIEFVGFRKVEMDTVDEKTGVTRHISGTSGYYMENLPQDNGIGKVSKKYWIPSSITPYSYFENNGVGKYDVTEFNRKLMGIEKVK